MRIVRIRPTDETENTVNYNEEDTYGVSQQGTNLMSGKWYTGECWAEGASPTAKIEWSIDGNGTLADELPSPPTTGRITVIEVSNFNMVVCTYSCKLQIQIFVILLVLSMLLVLYIFFFCTIDKNENRIYFLIA